VIGRQCDYLFSGSIFVTHMSNVDAAW